MPFEFVCSHWPSVYAPHPHLHCPTYKTNVHAYYICLNKVERSNTYLHHLKFNMRMETVEKKTILRRLFRGLCTCMYILLKSNFVSSYSWYNLSKAAVLNVRFTSRVKCTKVIARYVDTWLLSVVSKTTIITSNHNLLHLFIPCFHSSNLAKICMHYHTMNFVWQRKKCKPVASTLAMATDATRKAILYLCICLPNGLCVSVTRSVKTPLNDILDPPL